jgi:hypothetical protein
MSLEMSLTNRGEPDLGPLVDKLKSIALKEKFRSEIAILVFNSL